MVPVMYPKAVMTTEIVIFLAFTSLALITNAILLWVAYRGFANTVLKITQKAREFESRSATREFLNSLRHASEEVANATETAKVQFEKCESVLERTQARYGYTLAKLDTKFERAEKSICEGMDRFKDKVEGPAAKIAAFAAGMRGVATTFGSRDSD